jgi:DNA-binding response OmpR family regulator
MKKILIVDDDREFLEEIAQALRLNGYEPITESDSVLAFDRILKAMPDLILLDLKMDKKSGFKVADEIKANAKTKKIPVIAITGVFTSQEHKLLMKICNIRECFTKPLNPVDIVNAIEGICGK